MPKSLKKLKPDLDWQLAQKRPDEFYNQIITPIQNNLNQIDNEQHQLALSILQQWQLYHGLITIQQLPNQIRSYLEIACKNQFQTSKNKNTVHNQRNTNTFKRNIQKLMNTMIQTLPIQVQHDLLDKFKLDDKINHCLDQLPITPSRQTPQSNLVDFQYFNIQIQNQFNYQLNQLGLTPTKDLNKKLRHIYQKYREHLNQSKSTAYENVFKWFLYWQKLNQLVQFIKNKLINWYLKNYIPNDTNQTSFLYVLVTTDKSRLIKYRQIKKLGKLKTYQYF